MTLTDATFVTATFFRHPFVVLSVLPGSGWRYFSSIYAVVYMDTVAHELGHCVFALLFQVRVKGIRIGQERLSITLCRSTNCPIQLGIFPKSGRVNLGDLPSARWKQMTMFAGGALGSVVASGALWIFLPRSAWFECIVGSLICFASAVSNLTEGSDGAALRRLSRPSNTREHS